jgi:hypothetical protein
VATAGLIDVRLAAVQCFSGSGREHLALAERTLNRHIARHEVAKNRSDLEALVSPDAVGISLREVPRVGEQGLALVGPLLDPVATYPDGFRQWVYQGYSLWTYDGDKKPGDMTGNDDEVYTFSGMPGMAGPVTKEFIDIGTPQDGGAGLYWAIAIP